MQLTSSRASSGTGGMDSECRDTMVPAGGAGPGSASLGAAEGQALMDAASRPTEGAAAAENIVSGSTPTAALGGERPLIVGRVHSAASSGTRCKPGLAPLKRCARLTCAWQALVCSMCCAVVPVSPSRALC